MTPSEVGAYAGLRIRRLREEAHFSQRELARAAGVSQVTIHRWETGSADPTLGHLAAIAGVLGVPLVALLPLTDADREWVRRELGEG